MVVFNRMAPKVFRDSGRGASQCIIRQIPSPIVWVTSATKEGLIYFRDGKREDKVKSIKIFLTLHTFLYIYNTYNAQCIEYIVHNVCIVYKWLVWLTNPGVPFETI